MPRPFYVYEHWRPDKAQCFYVGKGTGDRAYKMHHRSAHHKRLQSKLLRSGFKVLVKIVAVYDVEAAAFEAEKALIARYRAQGVELVNHTHGGEGRSGYRLSDESKKRISEHHRGKPKSAEQRRKMSEAHKGHIVSDVTRAKISARHTGRTISDEQKEQLRRINLGKKMSPEACAKLSAVQRGKKRGPHSAEVKAKISAAQKGKTLTLEHRAKMALAQQARQKRAKMARSQLKGLHRFEEELRPVAPHVVH